MQSAIEHLVSLVRGDERSELRESIAEAALAAGLELPCLSAGSIDYYNKDSGQSQQQSGPKCEPSRSSCLSPPSPSSSAVEHHSWFDPFQYKQLSQPPDDILPYLGPGAYTFAGCLFWSVMEHFQSDCEHGHSFETPGHDAYDHSTATREIKRSLMRAMLNARLEYKRTGVITADNVPGGERDLGMILHKRILQEYRESGLQSELWVTSLEVERVAKGLYGEDFVLLEMAVQGEGDVVLVKNMEDLVCKLCTSAICFGDGPRWHISLILQELSNLQSRECQGP